MTKTKKVKIYKIYAPVKYLFDGNSAICVKVISETKDKIIGEATNLMGNQRLHSYEPLNNPDKIVIIKQNVVGWKELKW